MFGNKDRWLQEGVKLVVEIRVLQAIACYKNKETIKGHHTYKAPYIIRSCQKVTAKQ